MYYLFSEVINILIFLLLISSRLPIIQRILLWSFYIIFYSKSILCLLLTVIVVINGIFTKNRTLPTNIIKYSYNNFFYFSHNFSKLPKENTIILANHPHNLLDYVAFKMLPMKVAIVAGGLHFLVSWTCNKDECILYNLYKKKNFDEIKEKIKEKIKEMPILMFVENHHKIPFNNNGRRIAKLRTGIFHIAHELNIPITPMVIDRIDSSFGIIHQQPFRMLIGPTFIVEDPDLVRRKTYRFMKTTKQFMESYK